MRGRRRIWKLVKILGLGWAYDMNLYKLADNSIQKERMVLKKKLNHFQHDLYQNFKDIFPVKYLEI